MAHSTDPDVSEDHICRVRHNVGPEWRVVHRKVCDRPTSEPDRCEEDRSFHSLIRVERIPPDLPVALQSSAAVDVDIFAAKQEEAGCILEIELESVTFPKPGVVSERDAALDVHIDVGQIAQIERRANGIIRMRQKDYIW